ncbi:Outer membrane receptor proteins, mostly Fe transport [Hymenobacter gelipurpurascens]|uniref:Outer membrane receptor proteins, mostly Fe transport n=1 Tax=Hymenobacter gelipurpurascens TaxID=89968 RepID=A0A212TLL9_9BACT|nr:TonB-dependent receptor [Hymenobacter gelipurpurascens]SNC66937.1 Outer membrane receptor proteins, mostly Fe transport [Hymenobacter gelipurpurascens]
MRFLYLVALLLSSLTGLGQSVGILTGIVRDRKTQETIPGATVTLEGTSLGASSDAEGRYRLSEIPTGSYNVRATMVGYEPLLRANVVITSGNASIINLELSSGSQQLGEVQVVGNRAIRVATAETPLSVQRINTEEIKSNPGGNFDISKVIQTLPGVGGGGTGGTSGFRNDIIIRGGAPNENVYYLDGIEVPVINHFQTQGSGGGPTGILNVSFIEDVTLSSSAFEARYDNALSSVLQFRQRDGNPDRVQGNVRLSGTEVAGTLEGPLAKNTTFLASARRSYLQLLFKAIDLPIRPNYWDFQYKITTKLSPKTTLTSIGLGAIDHFELAVPRESSPDKEYILRSTPTIDQWNYTIGLALRQLLPNGFLNVALSRTQLDNKLDQFEDRSTTEEADRVLLTRSGETENKLRLDVNKSVGRWQYAYGAVGQYVQYDSRFFSRVRSEVRDAQGGLVSPQVNVRFQTAIDFARFGAFGQLTRTLLPDDRLTISAGLRADGNSFTEGGANLLRTLSPRVSASYGLAPRWNLNASVGRYYKIPPSTILGFRDEAGRAVNQGTRYIRSDHYVAGLEFLPAAATRFTLEGFYKKYNHYPVSVRDGISLANLGGDFAALGNEAVQSTGLGRAYGAELFFQQKLTRKIFAVASFTAFRSEFSGVDGRFKPSAWDSRFLASALLGRKFEKGWEMGFKYRFAGGSPYTPFDLEASRASYLAVGRGVLDYSRLNTVRLGNFQQFDFRLDKKFNWRRTSIDLFLDVQNAFLLKNPSLPSYTFQRTDDNSGFQTSDGQPIRPDGSNAFPILLQDDDPSVTPTIGFILEF